MSFGQRGELWLAPDSVSGKTDFEPALPKSSLFDVDSL